MIQIACCSCTQRKLKVEKFYFYTKQRFYKNINKVFIAPCPRYPYFKEKAGSGYTNVNV